MHPRKLPKLWQSADKTAQASTVKGNKGDTAEKVGVLFKDSTGITGKKNLKEKI